MLSLDGMMRAGQEMLEVATSSFQRAMKVQEVTSTKDNDSQPGDNSIPSMLLNRCIRHKMYTSSRVRL
jgi:hypothetical protein